MNNAVKAGQSTHAHWHLHPRYLTGTVFAGEEFPDPKWSAAFRERGAYGE